MAANNNRFKRDIGVRSYKKLFVICSEGQNTEPQYFKIVSKIVGESVHVKPIQKSPNSAPHHVLKRMKDYIKEEGLKPSDEAWLVIDKDEWSDEEISKLHRWSQEHGNRGLALSNPKFEYWLLLHYDEGDDIANAAACEQKLKRYVPNYKKSIDDRMIDARQIQTAIDRARRRDNPPCKTWPSKIGCTTVYILVEKILNHRQGTDL